MKEKDDRLPNGFNPNDTRVGVRERLKHFTWAWFASTMSTGAVAVVLFNTPNRFPGLTTIGAIFYILDLVMMVVFIALITTRFVIRPRAFTRSLHQPPEALFVGAFFVSVALVLNGAALYGTPKTGPWLVKALEVCFWLYAGIVFLFAVFQYTTLFISERLPIHDAMPAWILPIYPFLVLGPLAGTLVASQPNDPAVKILLGGICFQGLGWMVSIFMYTMYVLRLMSGDLPSAPTRPGMYISVGPAGYTSAAFVQLGMQAQKVLPTNFFDIGPIPTGDVVKAFGVIAGIFLWLLCFWFFCVSTAAVLRGVRHMHFTMNWWALIFPNGGLTLATIQIANALDSRPIRGICSAMTILLVLMWLIVAALNIRAVWIGNLVWPGKDEDKEMDV